MNLSPILFHAMTDRVQSDFTVNDLQLRGPLGSAVSTNACSYKSYELADLEGFRNVAIGTRLQKHSPCHPLLLPQST
jgi:hypothetical protein